MPEVPDDATLELWLLGDAYRLLMQGRDRRPATGGPTDRVTGLPGSAGELVPEYLAMRSHALVLQWPVNPRRWATVHMGLHAYPWEQWDAEARAAVDEATYKIARVIRRLAADGYMDAHPDLGYGEMGDDEAGMPVAAVFTFEGIELARERVRGTAQERGPVSMLSDLPPEQREQAADWIRAEWQHEARA